MRWTRITCASALAVALEAPPLLEAHDIWLMPERFVLAPGEILRVHQLAGSELESEMELELLRRITPSFQLITSTGAVDLLAELPDMRTRPVVKPVLERKLESRGGVLVAMQHAFIHNEFSRQKFLEYLVHEELDPGPYRPRMGRGPKERERYGRSLKALVRVGEDNGGDLHRKALGHTTEILLLDNPFELDPGDELKVQVLFRGRPLGDHLVSAFRGDGKRLLTASKAETDSEGVARFKLDRAGFWLIRLVNLLPCSERWEDDCEDVDWESYWVSYAFSLD